MSDEYFYKVTTQPDKTIKGTCRHHHEEWSMFTSDRDYTRDFEVTFPDFDSMISTIHAEIQKCHWSYVRLDGKELTHEKLINRVIK